MKGERRGEKETLFPLLNSPPPPPRIFFSLSLQFSPNSKRKRLVWKVGKGNKPNPNHVVTDGEEGKLFKSGQFGTFYPEDLQRIMWWFLSFYVGNFSKSLLMRRSFSWHCLQVSLLREQQ